MRQIVYISTASALQNTDLANILATAVTQNCIRSITGFLLYNGRNFLQLIEGATPDLMSLMNRLAADPRHSGMVTIEDRPIDQRSFPGWAMRLMPMAHGIEERRSLITTELGEAVVPRVRETVLNFAVLN